MDRDIFLSKVMDPYIQQYPKLGDAKKWLLEEWGGASKLNNPKERLFRKIAASLGVSFVVVAAVVGFAYSSQGRDFAWCNMLRKSLQDYIVNDDISKAPFIRNILERISRLGRFVPNFFDSKVAMPLVTKMHKVSPRQWHELGGRF